MPNSLVGADFSLNQDCTAREPRRFVQQQAREIISVGAAARPLMFAYWGRRGGLSQLGLDLARVTAARSDVRCTVSVSRQNEQFGKFEFLLDDLLIVDTYEKQAHAVLYYQNLQSLRRRLMQRFVSDRTRAFVSLMPHLWSPLVAPAVRRAGVRHVVVVHDADPHPGDRGAIINGWLLREAAGADQIIALTEFVADRLVAARGVPERKISVLFHPDLSYGHGRGSGAGNAGPLRVLFLGRILPYKGLGHFADAMALLRRDGVSVQVGVFGEGRIDPVTAATLSALGAEIENRWIGHDEFGGEILARYDVLAASHIEASQSGVVAAAFGAGMPVVAMPVGGLVEQITDGVIGILAKAPTVPAFADAVRRLAENRRLLARLRRGVAERREERSTEQFFDKMCEIALGA